MENGPLLGDNQAALENHNAPAAALPEFGYVVAQQNGKVKQFLNDLATRTVNGK